ncbi:MAG: hypothetical protein ACRC24_03750 [Vibrionaceae bacterium]
MRAAPKRSFLTVRPARMRGLSLMSAVIGMTVLSLLLVMAHITLQPMLADFGKIPREVQALLLADTIMSTLSDRLAYTTCQELQPIDWEKLNGCYASVETACTDNYQGSTYQGSIAQFLQVDDDIYTRFSAHIAAREESLVSDDTLPPLTSHRIDVMVKQAGVENVLLSTYWSGSACAAVLHQ